jgi:hypothetical protein
LIILTQLRKIARKYKSQAEEKDKEIEELKSKTSQQEEAQATVASLQVWNLNSFLIWRFISLSPGGET